MLHLLTAARAGARQTGFAFVLAALVSGGCAQSGLDVGLLAGPGPAETETASISRAPAAQDAAAKPSGHVAQARALRLNGDKRKALSILDQAAAKDAGNRELMAERGMLALELGQVAKAEPLLRKAIDPKHPDWRLHSALGAALSAAGKQQEAQIQFAKALELAPDHPSILNNLALSYALDGKHDEAERMLRRVAQRKDAAQSKQNLALILGLTGRMEEATAVSEAALPKEKAKANISYLQKLRTEGESSRISRADPPREASDTSVAAATPANQ